MGYELGSSNPNQPERARLDGDAVGIFFITGCALWTALITGGMAFLWIKRRMPFLRIRHLAITFTATIFLHLYWISVQIGYTVGPLVPEEIEYWFMGILYPVGLGLFFYGNAELLRVAKLQKQYLESGGGSDIVTLNGRLLGNPPPKNALSRAWRQFQQLDFAFRALLVVGSGMLFQVRLLHFPLQNSQANHVGQIFLTVLMFLVSRKFHSTWGIPGTEVHGQGVERKIQQGRGWEW